MSNFLNPEEILKQLNLRKDMVAADFGSGSGGWVLPLAKILEDGQVFAIDILDEPLSALRSKAKAEKITNIQTIKSDAEKTSRLMSEFCDLVLMTNLLFQCENKRQILEEANRVLKSGGQLLIVDWQKDNPLTKEIERVDFGELKEIAKELNLKLEKEFEAGPYHYGLIL